MPDISVGAQIFDVVFHPTESLACVGLLTGDVKAFTYDDQGNCESKFTLKPNKRSCRGLASNEDGSRLWAVGKGKMLCAIDPASGKVVETRKGAHEATINRVKCFLPNMLATGDDDGVVKMWDPRTPDALCTYNHHFDFISDFLWLEDKKHLICTSGDGTLSVLDVRSKKTEPFAQSEDQEDELLSVVTIKSAQKLVIGTQLGILSIFNRKNGYGDCVDRIPGHPHSIDALCNVPSHYPNAQSTILTGSSDGLLRAVQILPTKLLGVVADHGEFPIERIAVDRGGEGRWVGSVGHEEVLKLTDLKEVFEDEGDEEDQDEESEEEGEEGLETRGDEGEDEGEGEGGKEIGEGSVAVGKAAGAGGEQDSGGSGSDSDGDSMSDAGDGDRGVDSNARVQQEQDSSDEEVVERKKRKKKKEPDPFKVVKKTKGRNEIDADPSFFADL